jgi:hypothetical protein
MRWVIIFAASVLVIVSVCVSGTEYNTSVCAKTGMTRFTRRYGPFKIHSVRSTPLSQVLTQSGYRDPSQHEWVDANGGGWSFFHGRYCSGGVGESLRLAVESPEVASTVRLLIEYRDKSTTERWLGRVFDPDTSSQVSLYLGDVQEHTNKQDFIRWLTERETEIAGVGTK